VQLSSPSAQLGWFRFRFGRRDKSLTRLLSLFGATGGTERANLAAHRRSNFL
jgi:hypothetical protein